MSTENSPSTRNTDHSGDSRAILSIDQGTTSSRAVLFGLDTKPIAIAQEEFTQYFPNDGWVEHDPEEIWNSVVSVCRKALAEAQDKSIRVETLGITNQRETTVVWDRKSGKAIGNAIVWQDRRTADYCQSLKEAGEEKTVTAKTGLLLDPYFSGTKLKWILDNTPGLRERAKAGEIAFGTVDSFLLWRLTEGTEHATDATNASRTLLFNIHTQEWDKDLLELFDIPAEVLPEVKDSSAAFGTTKESAIGAALPIEGIAGDQQAATFGQACFKPRNIKSTYGTGCFALINTGQEAKASQNRLLTTVAYRLNGETTYALEGSIFVAGAAVQWLRDGLQIITSSAETGPMAESLQDNRGVYLVPAFTGLGAPWWDPYARGALYGLTRDTGPAEIGRATLESVCYQTHDLLSAMKADGGAPSRINVDGGMCANDWLMQFLSDTLDLEVQRPEITETTALGAALLAGLQHGLYNSLDEISALWHCERSFKPAMDKERRDRNLEGWSLALKRTRLQD
ncbi:glycerol kinase GlpK [Kiloniella sp. b19]|uniref:glycerol kinase GlpK n=1 Tax=Kiloniella sp. GXU_MW_B19 TaxID=3141326 RepID=UPI0031CE1397